jgi:hypothetical protein
MVLARWLVGAGVCVTYDNITMSGMTTPIFLKLDDQGRCPGHPPPGRTATSASPT